MLHSNLAEIKQNSTNLIALTIKKFHYQQKARKFDALQPKWSTYELINILVS